MRDVSQPAVGDHNVTAIVVNYKSGEDLRACLGGLLADEELLARVVVFDNGSGDDSLQPAEDAGGNDGRVELVRSEENLGLAAAVNRVLPSVTTSYVAVLNPDATPQPGWLEPLVATLDNDTGVAVACPLVLMEQTGEVNSAGQHVHVTGLGFNRLLHADPEQVEQIRHEVGGLHGVAFLIRTEILNQLGGWDQTGFLYHEDVALSWDVLLGGHRIVCDPRSRVLHDYHLTMYPEKLYLLERNRWALLLSHLRYSRLLLISPVLALTELMVWGLSLVRGRGFLRAKARAYVWVWRERKAISGWRSRVFERDRYDPATLYRNTRWAYPLLQLGILGGERGESARQPPGGLQT